ncbi:MAG: zinc ribbon domain-containing protein [Nitrospira sp.]|nr:zinc ribbon domain-containing protein [Nitrospira sp.]
MNFCSACGKSVSKKIPLGDNVARFVCDSCEAIQEPCSCRPADTWDHL